MADNKRVLVRGIDDIVVETEPVPVPGPGEVRVRSTFVGICGSDTHACLGRHPFIDLPYRPGHEVVGVVQEAGSDVRNVRNGDRVVVEPNLACGECRQCRQGRYNICARLKVFGCQTPGGMANSFVIAAGRLHVIPDSLADIDAVLIEPLATPVRAVRSVGDLTGRTVVVLGGGPIGLLVLVAARAAGAQVVALTDPLKSKRLRAERLSALAFDAQADDVVADINRALGGPADVVFDCVAREASMRQAVDLVAKGGDIVVVGVGLAGATPIRLDLVQDREIVIRGSLMFVREDFDTSIRLLAEGAVGSADLVTQVFDGLGQAAAAFRASTDPEECKILIRLAPDAG